MSIDMEARAEKDVTMEMKTENMPIDMEARAETGSTITKKKETYFSIGMGARVEKCAT